MTTAEIKRNEAIIRLGREALHGRLGHYEREAVLTAIREAEARLAAASGGGGETAA